MGLIPTEVGHKTVQIRQNLITIGSFQT